MKKYLVSGIGPGSSGVGRLMNVLVPEYRARGYRIIVRGTIQSNRSLSGYNNYLDRALDKSLRILDGLFFAARCLAVFRGEVLFLHPQTAGFWLFFSLALFNKVQFYVMDNSYFCICSYNTHPLIRGECLECLGKVRPHSMCSPAPVRIPRAINIFYLNLLRLMSSRFSFLAQNELQARLLRAHFGAHIDLTIVGMMAEGAVKPVIRSAVEAGRFLNSIAYDIVFHGATHPAKGIFYVLEIAELMPEFSFLIPDSVSNIIGLIKGPPPRNAVCIPMSWESGLREAVASARLVINPSMWSAPIEGALIKSSKYNQNVATVVSRYSYEAEIKSIINHIRLPSDPCAASEILRKFFANAS